MLAAWLGQPGTAVLYRQQMQNARVENGNLIIEARKEQIGANAYSSARLVTKGKGDWIYGRIDVRAKLPKGTGSWPAIWMLGSPHL
jgi:beta-glucanase (GH16 family)